jgi:hypothetical protein
MRELLGGSDRLYGGVLPIQGRAGLAQFFYFPADRCNRAGLWLHKLNPANRRYGASQAIHRTKAIGTATALQQHSGRVFRSADGFGRPLRATTI